jgi:hypothetical protein
LRDVRTFTGNQNERQFLELLGIYKKRYILKYFLGFNKLSNLNPNGIVIALYLIGKRERPIKPNHE